MAESRRKDGPTPNGGTYSVVYFLDDSGELVDEAEATNVELVEFDAEGSQVFRTYGQLTPQPVTEGGPNE